jgi:8-oxo-dGTP pyrophosphatase MutT (NUDIX family)
MRPRDAATLILVRDGREVLLGKRSSHHIFMPERYVFPGGRVDPGDARVARPFSLRRAVQAKLERTCSAPRASALAMAAVRETFEETGLVVGRPADEPLRTRSRHWRPFFATGHAPALDRLDYVARAITPPGRVRRFDARFFLVDARHAQGELRGNGELEDLAWVPLVEVERLPLASITRLVLQLLQHRLARSAPEEIAERVPLYRQLYGSELIEHH